ELLALNPAFNVPAFIPKNKRKLLLPVASVQTFQSNYLNAAPEHPNGVLVAANHVSWLDIFAMSAVYPSSFIAKQEIKSWPV
ncbi:1-acyl-sn-glycerol-3-phosphate acyltransferase, partial [Neisseria gonorrhoeae]|uniref:1-acyl-sn-glycerol-3-phosphate acyltransferase n=1 Tax=Neisseria gonorrhoeae TaxID=485 RepID=UPI00352D66CE